MIPLFQVAMSNAASTRVHQVLQSGYIGQGAVVEEFEGLLKDKFQNSNIVTVNSGTSALQLALRLIKDKNPNKRHIISTPLTCTATNWAILAEGFHIIWADIDPNTLNIDLINVEEKLLDYHADVAAVMVVHWGGYPVDIEHLKYIRNNYNIDVIEDCAHAYGSYYQGTRIGNSGNYCAFSFQAIKHLTTGDGGMLILPDEKQYRKAKLLRWYGIDRDDKTKTDFRCENDITDWGYKMHMNDINAAIGISNMRLADNNIASTHKNAMYLRDKLSTVKNIRLLNYDMANFCSFWIFSLLVDDRQRFNQIMKDAGIMVSQVHERNDKHTCVLDYQSYLSELDAIVPHLTAIPCGWWLSDDDLKYIVKTIKTY